MNVLVLGGNSEWHHEWVRDLGATLTKAGHAVTLHDYAHWHTGATVADIELEIKRISVLMRNIQNYAIIAKSVGTVIATLGIARGALRPTRCVMLGVPHSGIVRDVADFWPGILHLPKTLFIQNEHDPYGSAEGLDTHLERFHPLSYELDVVFDNATHDYDDFRLITRLLT